VKITAAIQDFCVWFCFWPFFRRLREDKDIDIYFIEMQPMVESKQYNGVNKPVGPRLIIAPVEKISVQ